MIKADKLARRVNKTPAATDQTASDPGGDIEGAADLPAMTLSFSNNGQLITTTKMGSINSKKMGRWRMTNFDPPATMTIRCFFEDFDDQGRELEVTWTDDQTIRLTPPNMSGQKMKMNFKKQ